VERYARLILEDIIAEAAEAVDTRPFLGLFVHVDNERARRFYRRAGFDDFGRTGWPHQKMLYDLRTRSL
jgi:ribosomal protein S18 acetylase RimI-like enzyme